jgi:hypothetical protein
MQNLEATGAFAGLNSPEERVDEQGQLTATIEATYKPPSAAAGGRRP